MAPPDKLPEAPTAAPAAPTAPTEGGVSAETVAQGQKLETRQELGALGQEIEQAQADAQAETTAAPSGTPPGTPPPVPGATTQEKPKTGWAGFVSSLSAGWSGIAKWLSDTGTKVGDWIKDLMGIAKKTGDEAVDKAKETVEGLVGKAKEAVYTLNELLNPKAPIFTFLSGKTPRITSDFGHRDDPINPGHDQFHKGVDVTLAPGNEDVGEPIVATRTLKVVDAYTGKDGANTIIVEDPTNPGVTYKFGHLETLNRAEGEVIQPGEMIAKIGNTGARTTGAHLHFEAKENGEHVDPAPYMGLA